MIGILPVSIDPLSTDRTCPCRINILASSLKKLRHSAQMFPTGALLTQRESPSRIKSPSRGFPRRLILNLDRQRVQREELPSGCKLLWSSNLRKRKVICRTLSKMSRAQFHGKVVFRSRHLRRSKRTTSSLKKP